MRAKFGDVGRLQIAAIGSEHGVETVRGGKHNLGDSLATLDNQGGSQQILEVVRKLAELPEPASGGIALERVHGATHASQRIGVARIALDKDPRFLELLQQILSALKEELAEFGSAFLGEKIQPATSMR